MPDENKSKKNFFEKAAFDIEHALGMYAVSYCVLPAESIYDKETLTSLTDVADTCHIYLIGYTPKIDFIGAEQKDGHLLLTFKILKKKHIISYKLPDGLSLKRDSEHWYLSDSSGERFWPDIIEMQSKLSLKSREVKFEVKYVGQAYGQDGSRNAIDRLLKHETLQKIALKGAPDGHQITLLLLAVQPSNQLFTTINPFAKNKKDGLKRIKKGLDKLFNTSEKERTALYEAALIRYFHPDFNKEFKDSFPSTSLKILRDCYEKDFAGIVAEICIDELPFLLWSSSVKPALHHIAKHDLHKIDDRKIFFDL